MEHLDGGRDVVDLDDDQDQWWTMSGGSVGEWIEWWSGGLVDSGPEWIDSGAWCDSDLSE